MKNKVKVQIVFYSMYGHIYRMAEAIAEGVKEVSGASVEVFRTPELVPVTTGDSPGRDEVLAKIGAKEAQKLFAHIPIAGAERLTEADALIIGTPTRFGNICSQMESFLDQTGAIWQKGALAGKAGSAFTSTGSQHGGQEVTLRCVHTFFLHHGMVVVGVPYSDPHLLNTGEVSGGTPYGASTIAGGDGSRLPSENELAIARFQGKHVAEIAKKLAS